MRRSALRTPTRTHAFGSCAARHRSRNPPEPEGADRVGAQPTLAVEGLQYHLSVYAAGAGRRTARRASASALPRHGGRGTRSLAGQLPSRAFGRGRISVGARGGVARMLRKQARSGSRQAKLALQAMNKRRKLQTFEGVCSPLTEYL